MKQEVKSKFPDWVSDNFSRNLILSDDIDSLFSSKLYQIIKGESNTIKFFYDFEAIYMTDEVEYLGDQIGMDIDLIKGKCFSNHPTKLSNEDSINPKSASFNSVYGVTRDNYCEKFAMSTLIQMMALYDADLSQLSEEAKLAILCVDGGFMGFFNPKFKSTWLKWMRLMEFEELIELTEKTPIWKFENIRTKYRTTEKIKVDENGKLSTEIDLEGLSNLFNISLMLPDTTFHKTKSLTTVHATNYRFKTKSEIENIFSLAMSRKNEIKYSIC